MVCVEVRGQRTAGRACLHHIEALRPRAFPTSVYSMLAVVVSAPISLEFWDTDVGYYISLLM